MTFRKNNKLGLELDRNSFENIYLKLNRRALVHPDPLEFLYGYSLPGDREIVGLIASCLAYGKVAQILKSVNKILKKLDPSPLSFILSASEKDMNSAFADFKHRFSDGAEITALLCSIKSVISCFGSLENCFKEGIDKYQDAENYLPALSFFVKELKKPFPSGNTYLLPGPEKGSACKRLNLYLRWMIRKDDVDPGGWNDLPASKLLIPLDTHMDNICRLLGMTKRRNADMKTVLEVTCAFRKINPDDPVKYDFALTRLGIRDDMKIDELERFLSVNL